MFQGGRDLINDTNDMNDNSDTNDMNEGKSIYVPSMSRVSWVFYVLALCRTHFYLYKKSFNWQKKTKLSPMPALAPPVARVAHFSKREEAL